MTVSGRERSPVAVSSAPDREGATVIITTGPTEEAVTESGHDDEMKHDVLEGETKDGGSQSGVFDGGRAILCKAVSGPCPITRHEIKAQSMTKEEQTIVTLVELPSLLSFVYRYKSLPFPALSLEKNNVDVA